MATQEDNAQEVQTTTPADDTTISDQTQDGAEDTLEGGEGAEPTTVDPQEVDPGEPTHKDKGDSDWRLKRINQLTFKTKQLEQENAAGKANQEALLAKVAALQNGQAANPAEAEAQIKALATEMAKGIAAQEIAQAEYTMKIDSVWNKGIDDFPDFKECVDNLRGSFDERFMNIVPSMAEALQDAHKIIHHLGTNLDEANRILSLSPARQIAEFTKLEAQLSLPTGSKPISKAPPPIKPLEGRAAKAVDVTNTDSTEQWIIARNKQIAAEKAAKARLR